MVRAPDCQWPGPGFESTSCHFETLAVLFTPLCLSSLSCINAYLVEGSDGIPVVELLEGTAFVQQLQDGWMLQWKLKWCLLEQVCQGNMPCTTNVGGHSIN